MLVNKGAELFTKYLSQGIKDIKKQVGSYDITENYKNEQALRAELFGIGQLKEHAVTIAQWHEVEVKKGKDKLLPRLAENEDILLQVYDLLLSSIEKQYRIAPAGEWLLDNFYMIAEQIRTAREHLPKHYSRELPHLKRGSLEGVPRVYDIALELISHSDGRIHRESLDSFVSAYQTEKVLRLGELWAIPIMLRLALLENLRRVAVRVYIGRKERDRANAWAERMIRTAEKAPKNLVIEMADLAREEGEMGSAFVSEFIRKLQGQNPYMSLPITWIEQRLSEDGVKIEQLVNAESQEQAADQVSIGNSINSLRLLGAIDWKHFVETMSVVHSTLLDDPAGAFSRMDFETRDRYRHVVENTVKHSPYSEVDGARKIVELAERNAGQYGRDDRRAHVGYFLLDRGLPEFEQAVHRRFSLKRKAGWILKGHPLFFYLGVIALLTASLTGLFVRLTPSEPLDPLYLLGVVLMFLSFSSLSVALVNRLAAFFLRPGTLPKMDFSEGLPDEARTLVIIPAIVRSLPDIWGLVRNLEVAYLSNRDVRLHFGLLTDLFDAPREIMEEDAPLITELSDAIQGLNAKYARERDDVFYLFHRPRQWNGSEGVWMGWERKRGKLEELNGWLLGRGFRDPRTLVLGNAEPLAGVRYVITLDSDTQLPLDTAHKLAGALAHPLNRAVYDEAKRRITEGYTILQPRVAIGMEESHSTRYLKVFGGEPGIDPYTRSVSDVYQDLFGEGSFIGKGIYDVQAFNRALEGRFPENRILSHDLIEGCYGRSGLLNDIQLYESYPSDYLEDVRRRHRWIRGDWQIVAWLRAKVPGLENKVEKNPLSLLSQWKILDNIRRSLVPPAMLLFLALGWTLLNIPSLSTLLVIGIFFIPSVLGILLDLFRKSEKLSLKMHFYNVRDSILIGLTQSAFALVVLPFEAYYTTHAIGLTLLRSLFTHKKMLQWNPSNHGDKRKRKSATGITLKMWFAPAVALALLTYFTVVPLHALHFIRILLFAWLSAPFIVWWMGRPEGMARTELLSARQKAYLHRLSRKTWHFFETFVNEETHWLPPDNYQETPVERLAERTSPTNIGLYLLSNLAAFDFHYLSMRQFLQRTGSTFETLKKLDRFRGHFYNWYDTRSLKPMPPLYISTVDSGNLNGDLLVLESALQGLPAFKTDPRQVLEGLFRTAGILREKLLDNKRENPVIQGPLQTLMKEFDATPSSLADLFDALGRIETSAMNLKSAIESHLSKKEESDWALILSNQVADIRGETATLAPWLLLSLPPPETGPTADDGESRVRNLFHSLRLASLTLEETARLETTAGGIPELSGGLKPWRDAFVNALLAASAAADRRLKRIETLLYDCAELSEMDYGLLYDKDRRLFCIGFNVAERKRDNSFYDLLASEARLTSFVAVARKQVPQEHWFALGRRITTSGGDPVLLSWGGSMFEYLMPSLIMPDYEESLLYGTMRTMVNRQIRYGGQRGVPWGISESGYNKTDAQLNYQYSSFGVPKLGFKPGLADDLVIAPYAAVLALMVYPDKACANLLRMSAEKFEGPYGFYEAVDYTRTRVHPGESFALVRSFMAHHQGMSLLALAYLLKGKPMQRRFSGNLVLKSAVLLLQERIPKVAPFFPPFGEIPGAYRTYREKERLLRVFPSPDTPVPEVHLLSNGAYTVMITNAGGGYSRWNGMALTRWREDATLDSWGSFCYIRDLAAGETWSTAFQPTLKEPKKYEAIFSQARAEFRRRDPGFDTHTEITVSPEDDVELRRVRLTNRSRNRKSVDLTSYAEVVLLSPLADELHPAFSNLFVKTEILRDQSAILCTRRPGSKDEKPPFLLHLAVVYGAQTRHTSFETDRHRFLGRGGSVHDPAAQSAGRALTDSEGVVLDPIVSIRVFLDLEPDQTVTVDFVSGAAETREKAISLIEKYSDRHLTNRVFALSWAHGQVVLEQLNASEADAQLYGRLAGSLLYHNPLWRAAPGVLVKNTRGQPGLWGYGISGDLPIVLVKMSDMSDLKLVTQMIQAHSYWRRKGLSVDLVILNEDYSVYRQQLFEQLTGMIMASSEASLIDKPGGIFIRKIELMPDEDKILFQSVARLVISDAGGPLIEQIERLARPETTIPLLRPRPPLAEKDTGGKERRRDLVFFNGLGGFTQDGREYVIHVAPGEKTPLPWSNVLANPAFGTVLSEGGVGYTWSENAHEFRVTPWANDPVGDAGGEALYLRDEETGKFWSPSPMPAPGRNLYISRHGFGYSVFEYDDAGIASELKIYVSPDKPVKYSVLKIRNHSGRKRRLSVTGYCELVLGDVKKKTSMHVVTEIDSRSGALIARNPYNTEFGGRTVFLDVSEIKRSVTGDRAEFLGRNGRLKSPACMKRMKLSGRIGPAFDPCAAMQIVVEIEDGQEREVAFILGAGKTLEEARGLIQTSRGIDAARAELEKVWKFWNDILGHVYLETPDKALDIMTNGWLLYQTIACRLFARSGYYQSGGAYGFRDQLQDVMALLFSAPGLAREHLLRAAARQFREGDVLHWWHPPSDRGVRTHCSDDYLWLPLCVTRYVHVTGDTGVLDESLPFLEGRPLAETEESYYDKMNRAEEKATLYEHCARALRKSLGRGRHGLPLMGSGDWNDGMNRVGEKGLGESVWLAFFLHQVLTEFSKIAGLRGDQELKTLCLTQADLLKTNLETSGWDGKWFRRAFFDDGEPLGSASNKECSIDSIPQSWSVLSGITGPGWKERTRTAMESFYRELVDPDRGLILLLKPPFDETPQSPGYIKGYVPGVRENGGQYTHAAIWGAMAFALLGDHQRAWELFGMMNPVNLGKTKEKAETYKVEPYVMAADIYSNPQHVGRGGWSWYTGSAGWMYRLITERLLGMVLENGQLFFRDFCLPPDWKEYKIHYRFQTTFYHISFKLSASCGKIKRMAVDGVEVPGPGLPLKDDHTDHVVEVTVG